eukprot:850962-Prorocentrum_minimum.AAC.1
MVCRAHSGNVLLDGVTYIWILVHLKGCLAKCESQVACIRDDDHLKISWAHDSSVWQSLAEDMLHLVYGCR